MVLIIARFEVARGIYYPPFETFMAREGPNLRLSQFTCHPCRQS